MACSNFEHTIWKIFQQVIIWPTRTLVTEPTLVLSKWTCIPITILVQTVGFVEKPGSLHRGMAVKTGTVKSGRVQPTTTTYVRPIVVAIELIALCVLIMIKNRCIIILYSCCVCSWAYFPLSSYTNPHCVFPLEMFLYTSSQTVCLLT